MPIKVKWNDTKDKTVIETHIEDPWTLEQFIEARKKWYRMIKSVDHYVPIVLSMHDTYEPPVGFLRQFVAIHRTPHPRQGHIYVMGMTPNYQKLSNYLFDGVADQTKSVKQIQSLDEVIVR